MGFTTCRLKVWIAFKRKSIHLWHAWGVTSEHDWLTKPTVPFHRFCPWEEPANSYALEKHRGAGSSTQALKPFGSGMKPKLWPYLRPDPSQITCSLGNSFFINDAKVADSLTVLLKSLDCLAPGKHSSKAKPEAIMLSSTQTWSDPKDFLPHLETSYTPSHYH